MELFEKIRRDAKADRDAGREVSIRALARVHGVHRRTVRDALSSPVPPPRKTPVRESPQLGPYVATIRGWLEADLDAPVKQRHTARRVWQRLVDEHGASVAESTVRAHVAAVKAELDGAVVKARVPQTKHAGVEAEVDFGELRVWLDGAQERVWMFVMRLSWSGRTFRRIYGNEAGEAFYDGHARAFEFFGGVPSRIRYDNLRPAVTRVLLGKQRDLNPSFVALRSHYLFESSFCSPGAGWEKGGVEGEIGRFRRNWLTPVPVVDDLDTLNLDTLDAAVDVDDARRHLTRDGQRLTVAELWDLERPLLAELPAEPAQVATELSCRVDNRARICVRQSFYSVPVRYVGRRLTVLLGASSLSVLDGRKVVATHPRAIHKGIETLVLDHYLETIARRPGALAGATALEQARKAGAFTHAHQRWWDLVVARRGEAAGTKALVAVLLEHRRLPAGVLVDALAAAVQADIVDPQVVIVEARRTNDRRDLTPVPIGSLALYDRPAPSVAHYDRLLEGGAA